MVLCARGRTLSSRWIGTATLLLLLLLSYCLVVASTAKTTTVPSWDELDQRRVPEWYDRAKFGIFLHWGVFSVPSMNTEWFWQRWKQQQDAHFEQFVTQTEKPGFTYQEYAHRFGAELYNPQLWAQAFAQSGAQYVILTAKHHEGFCNWDSKEGVPLSWNWNSMDIGPHRDLVGDLAVHVKNQTSPYTARKVKFGVYHSLFEWFNPLFLADMKSNFTKQLYLEKTLAELYDLVIKYEPELIWSDGDAGTSSEYWNAREFLHWYATESPVADTGVWNDRWGSDVMCKHGDFLTCQDRYSPGKLVPRKWENAFTIDRTSWGFNRNATIDKYYTVKELVHIIIETVAYNGNALMNIGPGADGTISPIFLDRLVGIGNWMQVNGDAIYGTRPWDVCQNETSVFYTAKDDRVFVILTEWPENSVLELQCPQATEETQVHFMGLDRSKVSSAVSMKRRRLSRGIELQLPMLTPNIIPCEHAWVLVLTGLAK